MSEFSRELRRHRRAAGLSLAGLAERTHYDRSHLHHAESGRRTATPALAEAVDRALDADGALIAAWQRDRQRCAAASSAQRTRAAALSVSQDLCAMGDLDIGDLHDGVAETAVDYLWTPPMPMMERAHALRGEAVNRIRAGRYRPHDQADLYVAVGRLSGILAYAALDLGDPQEAMLHASAAARCADFAGDAELSSWVAGTKSLIARFQGDYRRALEHATEGFQWVDSGNGTAEVRLRCAVAQCLANLGDSLGANGALDAAEDAREAVRRPDALGGLYGFNRAKQLYYAGSSLIWLDGERDAQRAIREATTAIGIWQTSPAEDRSLDDERLAHVYVATAYVQLDDVEGAASAVDPVLSLPAEDQISWIAKRMDRLAGMLSAPRYQGNRTAREMVEAIAALPSRA
jgi:transcriptional regulator with XRE-family HTH domain